jgi:RHS repeat-associated protein
MKRYINYTYGYDALNRLTQVQNGTATQQENYTYDPIGNRTSKSLGTITPSITAYVYDSANQLKEIRSGTATGALLASLSYDVDGNLKSRSDSGLTLNYDPLNRLTSTSQTGQLAQSYNYDDQGRRISKTVGTTTTHFLYNDTDIVAEYGTTWGLPTAQYTHGTSIDDINIRATATTAQYFHQDGLGSVVGVTNTAGLTDATQRFDAWGNKLTATGIAPRYGYTGREPDETGLIFYRARYYDPSVGRFTQRDPIGLRGGVNRYGYVGGNPTGYKDPSGKCPMCVIAAGFVVGATANAIGTMIAGETPSLKDMGIAGLGGIAAVAGAGEIVAGTIVGGTVRVMAGIIGDMGVEAGFNLIDVKDVCHHSCSWRYYAAI